MPDRLVELRFVVSVEDDIDPEIVADDFLADLRSEWEIAEMGWRVVPAESPARPNEHTATNLPATATIIPKPPETTT